jgi:hypothetical protein
MRARDFIFEAVSNKRVIQYIKQHHPRGEWTAVANDMVMKYPKYELSWVPVSQLKIDGDEPVNDPYGRVIDVDQYYASKLTTQDIEDNPIVIDLQGHILDGNHRAWQARELGITHVPAYVAVKELTESLDPGVEEFLNDLTPEDVGVDEVGDYRVHFEGFTDDCQSSRDYCRNPKKVFQEVFADFIRREGGQQPVASGMVGDEDYPILYSVFKNTVRKNVPLTPEKAYQIAYNKKRPWPTGSAEEQLIRSDFQLSDLYDRYVLNQTDMRANEFISEDEGLSYQGNCTDDDVIEYIFGDATGFAQAVDEYGDEFVLDDLVVKYNPEEDIHYFYYKS